MFVNFIFFFTFATKFNNQLILVQFLKVKRL